MSASTHALKSKSLKISGILKVHVELAILVEQCSTANEMLEIEVLIYKIINEHIFRNFL